MVMKRRIDIDNHFEFPDDKNWGRKFWKGFAIAVLLAACISLGLIRLGAYIAQCIYE